MSAEILTLPAATLVCPGCGTTASCNCGVAPIDRAAYALLNNGQKSDRAIAAEIGVDHKTVGAARRRTGETSPVGKRIGRDGKARRLPQVVTHTGETQVIQNIGNTEITIEQALNVLKAGGPITASRTMTAYEDAAGAVHSLRRRLAKAEERLRDAEIAVIEVARAEMSKKAGTAA